jgi:hypothetical protein
LLCALGLLALAPSAQAATPTLPRSFHGVWAADAEACAYDGTDHARYAIDRRFIIGAEHGYTIRRWTRRGETWVGRGTAGDDQGETPATVRLRLSPDGRLTFNDGVYIRCPNRT